MHTLTDFLEKSMLNYVKKTWEKWRDLCKTSTFAQSLRQTQILVLEILNVFLWLKFSSFLTLNKIKHFSKVSWLGPLIPDLPDFSTVIDDLRPRIALLVVMES